MALSVAKCCCVYARHNTTDWGWPHCNRLKLTLYCRCLIKYFNWSWCDIFDGWDWWDDDGIDLMKKWNGAADGELDSVILWRDCGWSWSWHHLVSERLWGLDWHHLTHPKIFWILPKISREVPQQKAGLDWHNLTPPKIFWELPKISREVSLSFVRLDSNGSRKNGKRKIQRETRRIFAANLSLNVWIFLSSDLWQLHLSLNLQLLLPSRQLGWI